MASKTKDGKLKFKVSEVDSMTLCILTQKGYQMELDGDKQEITFEQPLILC